MGCVESVEASGPGAQPAGQCPQCVPPSRQVAVSGFTAMERASLAKLTASPTDSKATASSLAVVAVPRSGSLDDLFGTEGGDQVRAHVLYMCYDVRFMRSGSASPSSIECRKGLATAGGGFVHMALRVTLTLADPSARPGAADECRQAHRCGVCVSGVLCCPR